MSTSGLAPVTVTVSSSAPTRMSAFTVAVNPPVSSMPSRLTVLKPGEREGDDVRAGPQVDDVVPALAVRHDGSHFLDQRRTGGFHGDARQHGAGRVSDHAGDAAGLLRRTNRCPCDQAEKDDRRLQPSGRNEECVGHWHLPARARTSRLTVPAKNRAGSLAHRPMTCNIAGDRSRNSPPALLFFTPIVDASTEANGLRHHRPQPILDRLWLDA